MRSHSTALGFALLSGLLFPLGLAPFNIWPLIPVSAGCLYAALTTSGTSRPWSIGWAYGLGLFGAGVSWVYVSIHIYGNTPVSLAVLLTAVFCGGLALLFSCQASLFWRLKSRHWAWRVAQFASIWVLFEWLRSWLLTGFPWAYAGYGALDSPLSGWIPLVGVFGCSWLLVALGGIGAEIIRNRGARHYWVTGGVSAIVAIAAGMVWSVIEWTHTQGEPLRVAVVQPNISLRDKWNRNQRSVILRQAMDQTTALSAAHDLLVWPESALPGYLDQLEPTIDVLTTTAAKEGATVITGVLTRDATDSYNSITAFGAGSGLYHKQKLVPFGEYVPLETWLRGLIGFFDLPMSAFSAGSPDQAPLLAHSTVIAPFICYEVVYPDFVAHHSRDAALLVTISNDTWFGNSAGPWQHFQMARFRAVELGRDLIRGTNDGVSALIAADGTVKATATQFTEAVVSGEVQPRVGTTPFASTGSLPVWVLSLMILLLGRDRP